MDRPTYNGIVSNEAWREACITSQQWATDARQSALRRKKRNGFIAGVMTFFVIDVLVALVLFLTGVIHP